jgi:CheY-like chemotaxis protein
MQAVGQLAGGIAHDFNNQLVGIVGCADILRAELAEHPELISFADKILGSARRASDLTAHLLAFARKGKFLAVPVDLHDIINEVVALLERSIDKQIHITLGLGAHPPTTLGDPSQLQNCFLNLALNARDAMPNGGELRFMTSIVHIDEEYCRANPYAIEAGDHVEISVSDTGVGMNQTVIEHIFEPFFTTKEKEKGTGMGLAAVYGTVKNHKGTIGVYSEVGRGTTFRVHLPLLIETEVPRTAEPEAQPIGAPPGAHILLVDDEEMVCETTCTMLRSLGYRVSICRNGQDAVDFIEHSADEIDLVILDMIMPVMGGGATFDALKKVNSGVRVLVSSGYSLEGEAQEILDRGARGFVQKPFLKTKLSRAVREALTVES